MSETNKTGKRTGFGIEEAMLAFAVAAAAGVPLLFMNNMVDQSLIKHLFVCVCSTGVLAFAVQRFMGAVEGGKTAVRVTPADLFTAGFLLWSLLTISNSINMRESFMSWGVLAANFIIYMYLSRAGRRGWRACLAAMSASGAAAAVYALVRATIVWRTGIDMSGDILYQMKNWLIAPMGGNNFTAAYLALGLAAAVGLAAGAEGIERKLHTASGVLQALALGACLSRTAIACAALYGVCMVVFMFAAGRRRAAVIAAGGGAVWILLIGILFYAWAGGGAGRLTKDLLMTRGGQSAQGTTSWKMRLHWWNDAVRMGRDNIVGGVGYGGFVFAHPRYRSIGENLLRSEVRLTTPHNDYLHAFAEGGAPGALLYAGMLLCGFIVAGRAAWKGRGRDGAALAAAGVLGVAVVYGVADFMFQMPASRLAVFIALGVAGGLAQEGGRGRKLEVQPTPALQVAAVAMLAVFAVFTLKQGTVFAAQIYVYKEIRGQNVPGKAIDEFMKAMRFDEHARYAHTYAGSAYFNAGTMEREGAKAKKLYNESVAMFERALEEDPYDYNAVNFMGVALYQSGRVREAAEQFNRAAEIYPKFSNPHRNLGVLWQRAGDAGKAWDEYQKSLELNPMQPVILFEMALMLENELRYPEALPLLERAAALEPGNREYRAELVRARKIVDASMRAVKVEPGKKKP